MSFKIVRLGIVASILPHLFCCVLPIVLSVIGLIAPEFIYIHIIPKWLEVCLFVFSGVILGVSWFLIIRECRCECDQCHGEHNHKVSKIILSVITILFVVSMILHVVLKH